MDSSALGNNKVNENALNAACTEEESTETGLAELLDRTRTQLRIVNALTRGFLNVFLADLDAETISILKLEGYVTTGLNKNEIGTRYSYLDVLKTYCAERVHPDDKEWFIKAISPEAVREALKKGYVTINS